ncbi:MAG: hypothetical protein ACRDTC_14865 [Pseudonocardiaceae bacterium]
MARDNNTAEPVRDPWPLTHREKERSRLVVEGTRTDDGDQCTLVVVHEVGGDWLLYPHGWDKFGVRLAKLDALAVAQAVLAGARE